jgi:hypothetical protein
MVKIHLSRYDIQSNALTMEDIFIPKDPRNPSISTMVSKTFPLKSLPNENFDYLLRKSSNHSMAIMILILEE